jgi:DnaJ-class molecular chaperone
MLGVDRIIKHLDGRAVPVRRKNAVTQPGQVEAIPNEGMPIMGAGKRGTLYVEFQVYLPTTLPKDLKSALEKLSGSKEEL